METCKGEIVLYNPNETIRIEVRLDNETVWLNRNQMAMLFGRDVKNSTTTTTGINCWKEIVMEKIKVVINYYLIFRGTTPIPVLLSLQNLLKQHKSIKTTIYL
ncbi:MAG: hypothetical protein MJ197_01525 [Bacteroidales bacterium]|nr:hypothetical protein [Bacteroidales bacterium]